MNNVNLTGRIASIKELENCTFITIAAGRPFHHGNNVEFVDCVAFSNNAKFINKYFEKGKPIEIQGYISKTEHLGEFITKVVIDNVAFSGSKPTQQNSAQPEAS